MGFPAAEQEATPVRNKTVTAWGGGGCTLRCDLALLEAFHPEGSIGEKNKRLVLQAAF